MRYLFFFVHPSKVSVFKHTINALKAAGNQVDVVITSKDVLEDLVKDAGWEYTNIFPEGRKIKGLPSYVSAAINTFRTIYRLWRYTRGKKYDLFITDDLLVYIGKLKNVPSIVLCDDDISAVKQFSIVLRPATHVLAPDITDLGKYTAKKIPFAGYKELAYLHPAVFTPDPSVVREFNPEGKPYFILRLVSLSAYHDVGMKGLGNAQVKTLIQFLETKGLVFISSERPLPEEFERYRLKIRPEKIAHVLSYATLFIGDSQTMSSEASVLGTPNFRCNDFVGKISVMDEKEAAYGLSFNFKPADFEIMFERIQQVLGVEDLRNEFKIRREKMLNDKINLSAFMTWLFGSYPASVQQLRDQPFLMDQFKQRG